MKLPFFKSLPRFVATSGASALCFALCLGLWSASSSFADSITDADATKIGNAVRDALYGNDGYLFTMPLTDYETWEGFQWLLVDWEKVGVGWNAGRINDILYRALPVLTNNVDYIVKRLETGLFTGAQREQLLSWLSDIQMWGEVSATANGYRTYSQDKNLLAWSVSDDDAVSRLTVANGKLDEILAALQSPGNWEGLEQIISGGIQDASNAAKDTADISDQQALAANALASVEVTEERAQTEGEAAEQDSLWALDDLIHDEHSALPFLENIPELNVIPDAPFRTIRGPDDTPFVEDWLLVGGEDPYSPDAWRLFDEDVPGSIPLPPIVLKHSATVTSTSRPFFNLAGRITSSLWGLAFGVWILHVARSDWSFYTSGGGSDATMLAEQMEARRCLDINAALFGDSSLL